MPETGPKEIDSSEIVQEQKKDNTSKESTIKEALQESLPNDESKQKLFLEIFNQPTFSNLPQQSTNNELSQANIIEYIKKWTLIGNSRQINKMNALEEKIKFIIEDMDKYFFATTWSVKEIMVTNNNLTEQVDQTTEQVKIKNTLLEARETTQQSYDDLADQYKVTDEQLQKQKANIPQNIITQVSEKTQGTEFSPDDYLKFYLTAENNKDALQGTEFMTNYEALNDILGIAPENTTMKKLNTKPNQVDTIVTSNPSLNTYSSNSEKLNKIQIPGFPTFKTIAEEFDFYIKFVPDTKVKKNLQDQEETIKNYTAETADETSNKTYTTYQEAITQVQEQLPERIKTISKQRVLGSCVSGLASYFDDTRIGQENFADIFDINTQAGFAITKGQNKYNEEADDVLTIKGNIGGNNIGFHYNLDNPDAQLKADDHLNIDTTSNLFSLGVENGGQKELGIQLPTIGMLSTEAQRIIDKYFIDGLQKSENLEDFEATLKQKISNELSKNYGQEAFVKTRVRRDIEKNLTTQTFQNTFIPSPVLTELNRDQKIDKTNENNARNMLNIRDKTTENMTSYQLHDFRKSIERLEKIIDKEWYKKLEPERTEIFSNIQKEKSAISYNQERGTSSLKLFKFFSKENKINTEDLNIFIDTLEKQESIAENIKKFSPDFQTTQDHEDADQLLNNIT